MLAPLLPSLRAAAHLTLIALAAALVVIPSGCAGSGSNGSSGRVPASADWSSGIPDPEAAVVTIENLSYDPPRVLGLVGDQHPSAMAEDAELRRAGIKRVPGDRMEVLLDELVKRGFLADSQQLAEFAPADPSVVLRRLVISAGGERRAFTLPRRPQQGVADRFNAQSHAVQAMFNEVVDFRLEGSAKSATHFYQLQQRLFDVERTRRGTGRSP